jgi:predicted dehydrogenase
LSRNSLTIDRPPTTRRRFLASAAGLLAGSVAAPLVIPSSALGLDRPAPSERITIGFIGLGWKGLDGCAGSLLRHFLENPTTEPLAFCDVNRNSCKRGKDTAEKDYGRKSGILTQDFREVCERPDIDAVVIATPDHWHAIITIWACRNGKDVYCEKPLSLTIREARAMVNAARRYGRIVQTGNQSRSNLNIRYAIDVMRKGKIGELKEIHASCGAPSVPCYLPAEPQPDFIDWEMWLGPAPWRPYHSQLAFKGFRSYRDYSGGGMTDWGAHHFDLGQWALGMDESGPVEIIPPDGRERKWLTYRYANGTEMYHNNSWPNGGVNFLGTEGKMWIMGVSNHMNSTPEGLCKTFKRRGGADVFGYDAKDHSDNFLECVRSRQRPNADVEIGCRTVTVCHLGNIAYWLNRPIRWDPVREEIIGDEEASRWLDRAKREPWTIV